MKKLLFAFILLGSLTSCTRYIYVYDTPAVKSQSQYSLPVGVTFTDYIVAYPVQGPYGQYTIYTHQLSNGSFLIVSDKHNPAIVNVPSCPTGSMLRPYYHGTGMTWIRRDGYGNCYMWIGNEWSISGCPYNGYYGYEPYSYYYSPSIGCRVLESAYYINRSVAASRYMGRTYRHNEPVQYRRSSNYVAPTTTRRSSSSSQSQQAVQPTQQRQSQPAQQQQQTVRRSSQSSSGQGTSNSRSSSSGSSSSSSSSSRRR